MRMQQPCQPFQLSSQLTGQDAGLRWCVLDILMILLYPTCQCDTLQTHMIYDMICHSTKVTYAPHFKLSQKQRGGTEYGLSLAP